MKETIATILSGHFRHKQDIPLFLYEKDLARPQHRTIMVFVTNSLTGNVPNF